MTDTPESKVTMPFDSPETDTPPPAAKVEKKPEEKPKPRKKATKEPKYVVASTEGIVICGESQIVNILEDTNKAEVWLLGKKMISARIIPMPRSLLGGKDDQKPDRLEIKFEK